MEETEMPIEETESAEDLDKEINLMEFELDDEQIDDLIEGLKELKEHKQNLSFTIDDENDLLIHHEDEQDLEEGDDSEDGDGEEDEEEVKEEFERVQGGENE